MGPDHAHDFTAPYAVHVEDGSIVGTISLTVQPGYLMYTTSLPLTTIKRRTGR